MKGKFITFEGCEGSGKSTQLTLLKNTLEDMGISYVFTREPGGNPISEKIRSIILDGKNSAMTDECEALLYAAARVQVLNDVIAPALSEGKIVVSDRYVDSSFAYQGNARGLGFDFVARINSYAVENFTPDITVFLDIDPVSAFKRKNGADEDDRMEQAGIAFHLKVYEGYKKLAELYPQRFICVDAHSDAQTVHKNIISLLKDKGII